MVIVSPGATKSMFETVQVGVLPLTPVQLNGAWVTPDGVPDALIVQLPDGSNSKPTGNVTVISSVIAVEPELASVTVMLPPHVVQFDSSMVTAPEAKTGKELTSTSAVCVSSMGALAQQP